MAASQNTTQSPGITLLKIALPAVQRTLKPHALADPVNVSDVLVVRPVLTNVAPASTAIHNCAWAARLTVLKELVLMNALVNADPVVSFWSAANMVDRASSLVLRFKV